MAALDDLDPLSDDYKRLKEWEAFKAECHAKGQCEFSGLRVTACVRSICDCFESEEGAREIERKAGLRR